MLRTFAPILSIILAVLVFIFYVKPTYDEIGAVQAETAEFQEAVAKASEFNQALSELVTRRASLSASQIDKLEVIAPDEAGAVKYLVDLEAMAVANNLLFGNTAVEEVEQRTSTEVDKTGSSGGGTTVTAADFETIVISFSVIGTYDQFRTFLATLESSMSLVDVSLISLTVSEGDLQQFDLSLERKILKPLEI